MKLSDFKSFSEIEKEQCVFLYANESWRFNYPVPDNLFDIEWYYEQRFERRKESTNITWPEHLSKREKAVCKVVMILRILNHVNVDRTEDSKLLVHAVITFLKDIEHEILAFKTVRPDGSKHIYPGISPDIAKVLNALYKSLSRSFKAHPFIINYQ